MQKSPLALTHKALAAIVFALAGLWLVLASSAWAQPSPPLSQPLPVPELSDRVIDQSGTLSRSDIQALTAQLQKLEEDTGAQLAVLMVPSTGPEDIAAYAWRIASRWELGRQDIGDGALIVVAKNDRRMRIEVARKLEGAIPDIMAARIIDDAMKPRFRNDDYAGGLSAAIDQLGLLIRGEKLPAPRASQSWAKYTEYLPSLLFFGLPFAIAIARSIFGRFIGSLVIGSIASLVLYAVTNSLIVAGVAAVLGLLFTLLSNLSGPSASSSIGSSSDRDNWSSNDGGSWSSSDSSSSFGGSDFSSGGGGSFGGGGASGDW